MIYVLIFFFGISLSLSLPAFRLIEFAGYDFSRPIPPPPPFEAHSIYFLLVVFMAACLGDATSSADLKKDESIDIKTCAHHVFRLIRNIVDLLSVTDKDNQQNGKTQPISHIQSIQLRNGPLEISDYWHKIHDL